MGMAVNGNSPIRKGFLIANRNSKRLRSSGAMLYFLRKKPTSTLARKAGIPDGYTDALNPDDLLATAERQHLVNMIWQRTALSSEHFERLYLAPIRRYADLVQRLPASENHHHAYPGGLLDHGLEIIVFALKLRQNHLLPSGAAPEDQSAEAEAWTAGLTYAALLHDLGKIAVDQHIELASGKIWHPWQGPLTEPYRMKFVKGRDYSRHPAAGSLLALQVLSPAILDWLAQTPALFGAMTCALSGHYERAGTLGELVIKADQASVSRALGGNPTKAVETPRESLQGKLVNGLRYLVQNEFRLNQPGSIGWLTEEALWLVSKPVTDRLKAYLLSQGLEGVPHRNSRLFDELQAHSIIQPTPNNMAIWNCTVDDPGRHWSQRLTMLKVAPALIWGAEERPDSFTGTVEVTLLPQTTAIEAEPIQEELPPAYEQEYLAQPVKNPDRQHSLFPEPIQDLDANTHNTLLQPPSAAGDIAPPLEATNTGTLFLMWLRQGLLQQKIVMNDVKARVHTVAGTFFLVTPGIFQRFALEHPQIACRVEEPETWRTIQKQFQKLRLHRKTDNGLNIWTCTVSGQKRTRKLKGYLMNDPATLMASTPYDNPFLSLDLEEQKHADL